MEENASDLDSCLLWLYSVIMRWKRAIIPNLTSVTLRTSLNPWKHFLLHVFRPDMVVAGMLNVAAGFCFLCK